MNLVLLVWVSVSVVFFFSSRRRHTRSLRDWSSDVCSSDLAMRPRSRHAVASSGVACHLAPVALMSSERIAAFAYHDVTDDPRDSGFHGAGALPFKLGRTAFARHLDAMAETGAQPQLVTAIDCASPGRTLLLTFDDGGASALHAGDELCRRGWRGHFFIVTGSIGARA